VFCSAPRPVFDAGDEARCDRVREDVLDRVSEVLVVLDDGRGETVAEQVPLAAVPTVELLCVDAVHALHARRERRERALHDEMEVSVHQAPGKDPPASLQDLACEQPEQKEALVVAPDDRGGRDAEDRDVVRPVLRKVAARDSWDRSPTLATLVGVSGFAANLSRNRHSLATRGGGVSNGGDSPHRLGGTVVNRGDSPAGRPRQRQPGRWGLSPPRNRT
jgi:hypothetical protein